MACCLTAVSYYLNQCWLLISGIFCGIHLRTISPRVLKLLWCIRSLKIRLSVRLSVCLSHLFHCVEVCSHHRIIMKFSGVITNDICDIEAKCQGVWGVKWTLIPHLPISLNNFRYRKIITDVLIYRYGSIIFRIRKIVDLPISVNRNYLPISEIIYRYQKFEFTDIGNSKWITDIGKSIFQYREIRWFSDIGKSNNFPISVNRISDIGKSVDLPISENNVELPIAVIRISDMGKSTDYPISENKNEFPISVNKLIYRYRKSFWELPISEIRIFDIGKSDDFLILVNQDDLPISEIRISDIGKCDDLPISENDDLNAE